MGNCPTCSPEYVSKSLDPVCNGTRMWTTFLFSSLVVLFTGSIIICISEAFQILSSKWRTRHPTRTKNVRHLQSPRHESPDNHDDITTIHEFNRLNEIKNWQNNFISGQTILGKIFVRIPNKIYNIL
ncbi:unnamed protein product [Adineta steineri]|uniref:Uncharacterized protein n=1 Tax=Adineta steineri TaxID=433720 RepID=A0A814UXE6_9BILA|nr:unnamed protein product [Adineta steineri]